MVRSPRLDVQVKATEHRIGDDPFPFDLEVKSYDELRSEQHQVPRILVVVILPKGDLGRERGMWQLRNSHDFVTVADSGE